MKQQIRYRKNLKAYSLLEVLVTLIIVAIILVALTNILINSLLVAKKSYERSALREEQSQIINRIEKDIRNAAYVESCSSSGNQAFCQLALDKVYVWKTCNNGYGNMSMCKYENYGEANEVVVEALPDDITVNKFSIEEGLIDSASQKTILITLVFSHRQTKLSIDNQTRQVVIATRNYKI